MVENEFTIFRNSCFVFCHGIFIFRPKFGTSFDINIMGRYIITRSEGLIYSTVDTRFTSMIVVITCDVY